MLGKFADALFRNLHALLALERERLGHYRHGQNAQFSGHFRENRRGARTCATAHAGRDEYHVRTRQNFRDLIAIFQSSLTTDFGVCTSTQPLGHAASHLQECLRAQIAQRLSIRIGTHKLDALNMAGDHVSHRIASATTHTDYLDDCVLGQAID